MRTLSGSYSTHDLPAWPENGLERVSICPVCCGDQRRLIHEKLSDKIFECAPGYWDMFECRTCRSAYLDPRPTESTIGLAYSTYFTHELSANADYGDLGLLRRFKRALANGYRNHRFSTDLRPSSKLGVLFAFFSLKFRSLLDAERRHIPPGFPGSRLLDIGCGNGEFLVLAAQAGWSVVGLEPDPKAAEAARTLGLDVRQNSINSLNPEIERFDGITLSHVIEHLHDPFSALQRCYDLLNPGGWIWIETPNVDAQGHELFGPSWRGLEPPRHLVLFNRPSLIDVLRKVGFTELEDLPYRPLCDYLFKASHEISTKSGVESGRDAIRDLLQQIRTAETRAKRNVALREFVAVRAKKPIK